MSPQGQALQTNVSGTAVATADASNPYAAYAAEASTRTIIGTLLKFAKGEWTKGQNDVVVPVGTKFVVDMRNVQVGWVRWENKKPAEHVMGRVADGYRPGARQTLGYNDKAEWEFDKDNKPQDPWQSTSVLFLMNDEAEMFTYSPSSAGGRNAVIALCGAYGKMMRQHPGELPVVELGVDSYRHETYGKTFVPVLKIVGWHSELDFDEAQAEEEAEAAAREASDQQLAAQAPQQQQIAPPPAQEPVQQAPVQQQTTQQAPVQQAAAASPAPAAAGGDGGFGFKKGKAAAAGSAARF